MQFYLKVMRTTLDAFQIYKLIAKGKDYIFLDSSKEGLPYGHYSIMGANPFLTIKYANNCIYEKVAGGSFNPLGLNQNIFDYLNRKIGEYKIINPTDLPFIGGAIGYFSYDFACRLKLITKTQGNVITIPEVYFVFYDNAVIVDHDTGKVSITGLGILRDAKKSVAALIHRIKTGGEIGENQNPPKELVHTPFFKSNFSKSDYIKAVKMMQSHIQEGDISLANMTHTFSSRFQNNPQNAYEKLRMVNPAPFSAYLPLEGFYALCSSPERFLKVRNRNIQTRPIKGTIARGATLQEDEINKSILENSEKERSELSMIAELKRNDLIKICKPGTVEISEMFKIEAFASVFHLVSTIVGVLKDNCTAVDCIEAVFPSGSITGRPKSRAMRVISELERNQRNLYTGSIGYFGFDGNADFNIVIRSVLIKDNYAHIGVGGGITCKSDAQSEYNETIAKAIALFRSLEADYFI